MKKVNVEAFLFIITITAVILSMTAVISCIIDRNILKCYKDNSMESLDNTIIKLTQPEFFLKNHPDSSSVMEALIYYDIKYPNIVLHQAILETGDFKSRVCKEYNNLFGLYNSKTKDYYKFNHWSSSILAYKKYIQYKYIEGDYYIFLENIRYAEDPFYINKLKQIANEN